MQKIKIFINGFGRIGRSALRIMLEDEAFEVVGINDLYEFSQLYYLLKHDSTYKKLPFEMHLLEDTLHIAHHKIKLFHEEDPLKLDLTTLKIDILLQCSGHFLTQKQNQCYLAQGVSKVIVSAPAQDDMPTYIRGLNHHKYQGEPIISASSCSVNAIAPLMHLLEAHFKILNVAVSMIHSYTNEQSLLDTKTQASDPRRSRSATQNVLPLHSSATKTLEELFTSLRSKIYTKSIRIPLAATTLYDFTFTLKNRAEVEAVKRVLIDASHINLKEIMDIDTSYKVSSDYITNRHSLTIDLPLLECFDNTLKITAWQDNEYGYAYQLIHLAKDVTLSS